MGRKVHALNFSSRNVKSYIYQPAFITCTIEVRLHYRELLIRSQGNNRASVIPFFLFGVHL
jgi:hypothetical protein